MPYSKANGYPFLRRRLKEDPLTIRIKLPGGGIFLKKIGGAAIDTSIVERVSARFLGLFGFQKWDSVNVST